VPSGGPSPPTTCCPARLKFPPPGGSRNNRLCASKVVGFVGLKTTFAVFVLYGTYITLDPTLHQRDPKEPKGKYKPSVSLTSELRRTRDSPALSSAFFHARRRFSYKPPRTAQNTAAVKTRAYLGALRSSQRYCCRRKDRAGRRVDWFAIAVGDAGVYTEL
jgi:hypothetical protein